MNTYYSRLASTNKLLWFKKNVAVYAFNYLFILWLKKQQADKSYVRELEIKNHINLVQVWFQVYAVQMV